MDAQRRIDWKEAARHYRTMYSEAVERGCHDRDFWRGRTFTVEREGAEHRREMQAEIARLRALVMKFAGQPRHLHAAALRELRDYLGQWACDCPAPDVVVLCRRCYLLEIVTTALGTD